MAGTATILSKEDKMRARYHLGYGSYTEGQAFAFGIITSVEPWAQAQAALDRMLPEAVSKFRQLINVLECIECEVYGTTDLATIESTSDVKVNRNMLKELRERYQLAQQGLSNLIGCIPNVWDQRQWLARGGGLSVPVL